MHCKKLFPGRVHYTKMLHKYLTAAFHKQPITMKYLKKLCNKSIDLWDTFVLRQKNYCIQTQTHHELHTHACEVATGARQICVLISSCLPIDPVADRPDHSTHTQHPPCSIHYCWHSTFNYAAVSRSPSPQIHFNKLYLSVSSNHLLSSPLSLSRLPLMESPSVSAPRALIHTINSHTCWLSLYFSYTDTHKFKQYCLIVNRPLAFVLIIQGFRTLTSECWWLWWLLLSFRILEDKKSGIDCTYKEQFKNNQTKKRNKYLRKS